MIRQRSRAGVVGAVGVVAAAVLVALGAASGAASAPPNDTVTDAEQITTLPATVEGTTEGAKLSAEEPVPSCAAVKSVVWYQMKAPHRGALVARVLADAQLDAALVVRRIVRTSQREITCTLTDRHGRAAAAWYGYPDGSYLIGVGRRVESPAGEFRMKVLAAERPPAPPGDTLPSGGVRATIEPILDTTDAWAVRMERGTSYRINVTTPSDCLGLDIYAPETFAFAVDEPVRSVACAGYVVFTPGIDGGGTYSLVVRAASGPPGRRSYRIEAAAFGPDDGAPGIALANGQEVEGTIFGRGIDVVDLYRIAVPRENELTKIDLDLKRNVGLDLLVLDEAGRRVACACGGKGPQALRRTFPPGHYFLAVRSRDKSGGRYRLQALSTDITTTTISSGGATSVDVPSGTAVTLTVQVSSASHGGPVELAIDHRDPLYGWQFSTVLEGQVDTNGTFRTSWTPPWAGYWRAHARFTGTPYSSFSESGYLRVHVTEPLE